MRRRNNLALVLVLLLITSSSYGGALKFVGPVAAGTGAGTSWANRAKGDSAWFRTVAAGDTVLFYPGTYSNLQLIPPERTAGVMTYYWAGDGLTNAKYDPGVSAIGSSYTRYQFEQSLLMAKTCTLTAGRSIASGATWTNYSGNVYYYPITLERNTSLNEDGAVACLQDTTILDFHVTSAGVPTSAGQAFYDMALGRLYVWTTDGSNPSTHNWLASRRQTVNTSGGTNTGNFQLYGFDIRCNVYAGVYLGGGLSTSRDSIFVDHCRITKIVAGVASNGGALGCFTLLDRSTCGGAYDCTYAYDHKYNRIRACYVSEIYETGYDAGRSKIVTTYAQSHMVIESCLAVRIGGVDWKNQAASGSSYGGVFRFNTVRYWPRTAYENLCGHMQQDSCYGNIFIGDPANNDMKAIWFQYSALGANLQRGSGHFVANNTFYQCEKAIFSSNGDDRDDPPNWIKYNIFYGSRTVDQGHVGEPPDYNTFWNDTNFVSDSNLYYSSPSAAFRVNLVPGVASSSAITFAQWQTRRAGAWAANQYKDLYSSFNTTNPNFVNAAAGDLRRTGSPVEMNVTYGGFVWTSFGAYGASASSEPDAATSLYTDSLQSDYSGESDSIRVRFTTAAQSWPDSVIVAVSLVSATLPTYSQGTNRWAYAYPGSSATDTVFPTLSVTEADTLVVGAWVSDADSGYSSARYDTLILSGSPGACCFTDGTCQSLGAVECAAASGDWQGEGVPCSPNPCPQPPTGACCAGASCSVVTEAACDAAGGVYQGDDTDCDPNPCASGDTTTTIDSVSVSSDDCTRYSTASINTTTTYIPLGFATYAHNPGMRFSTVAIPQGATIVSALISLYAGTGGAVGAITLTIRGEDTAAPGTYSTAGDFDARSLTTASVPWSTTAAALVSGSWYQTPDISTIIQEIVNRADWAAGNNLAVQIRDNSSAGYKYMQSVDDAAAHPPFMTVRYVVPGNEPSPTRRVRFRVRH